MGGSLYSYEAFDGDLTRPLYGHVTELKQGTVPTWVQKPVVGAMEVRRLFELDETSGKIPRSKLPDSVKRKRQRKLTRYKVDKEAYLEAHRERIKTADNKGRFRSVRFELDKGKRVSGFGNTYDPFPDEIDERLGAVRDTGMWDTKIDGYHKSFRKWVLVYRIGPRGGINDVQIMADIRH